MSKRMLIDGTHSEETRVVITSGNRLDEYDVETSTKSQLRGNIYLAKVTRVEPSLQAAFVDFGGNRHGFLAFNEIHPDYYQIPKEDREKLMRDVAALDEQDEQAQAARAHVDSIDGAIEDVEDDEDHDAADAGEEEEEEDGDREISTEDDETIEATADHGPENGEDRGDEAGDGDAHDAVAEAEDADSDDEPDTDDGGAKPARGQRRRRQRRENPMRRYRIQEVIKRRQILLVQVVKEERGNKGAALTTYLSLAGRYCVLMPNAVRGGGISRKITSVTDRRRLRDLVKDLNVPDGMGVIMRTAGMERSKAEIKRDFDYLTRVWEDVRELTLKSAAPALVYEEGNLIKRAIRDLYTREIEEVLIEGQEAYQVAKKLMRMMMPSHAKRVQPYRDPTIPLFHRYQVETQLEAMHSPVMQLKSGGYLVINPTEALVSIDVNSGRSTKERNIEETALKTNLEAATELARQLRMRDLAGLIVIDFIDMEDSRNQRAVERRLKDAVKSDRARIQLGRISTFGLFELSRQRMRPSLVETSTEICRHCHGTGYVRSIESMAIRVLRMIEEEGIRNRSSEVAVSVATPIALYVLNQKRDSLIDIEQRYAFRVAIHGDDSLIPPDVELERTRARSETDEAPAPIAEPVTEIDEAEDALDDAAAEAAEKDEKDEKEAPARKRRPRRRRRKDADQQPEAVAESAEAEEEAVTAEAAPSAAAATETDGEDGSERQGKRRRRGRRGGRRRGGRSAKSDEEAASAEEPADGGEPGSEAADLIPDADDNGSAEPAEEEFVEAVMVSEPEPAPEFEPEREPEREPVAATAGEEPAGTADTAAKHQPGSGDNGGESPEELPPSAERQSTSDLPPSPPKRGWWQRMVE